MNHGSSTSEMDMDDDEFEKLHGAEMEIMLNSNELSNDDLELVSSKYPPTNESTAKPHPQSMSIDMTKDIYNANDATVQSSAQISEHSSFAKKISLLELALLKPRYKSVIIPKTYSINNFVMKFPPADGSGIPIRLADKKLYYLSTNSKNANIGTYRVKPPDKRTSGLVSKHFSEVIREADQLFLRRKEQARINELSKSKSESHSSEKQLWVDKYAPTKFSQLLSDDMINREVLRALKLWDNFVFSRKPEGQRNIKQKLEEEIMDRVVEDDGLDDSFKDDDDDDMIDDDDDDDGTTTTRRRRRRRPQKRRKHQTDDPRPEKRLILLSGPPGTGKTTLAHIIAKQAGYRPMELNASDDRSIKKLEDVLLQAASGDCISMDQFAAAKGKSSIEALLSSTSSPNRFMRELTPNPSNNPNTRPKPIPNCLILDEIDGVDNEAVVTWLLSVSDRPLRRRVKKSGDVKMVDDDSDVDDEDSVDDNEQKQKKKKTVDGHSTSLLQLRPIICICNDKYSPQLRSLRQRAIVFDLLPASTDPDVSSSSSSSSSTSGSIPVQKMLSRLQDICKSEGISVSPPALIALLKSCGGDIRSCINLLQFAAISINSSDKSLSFKSTDITQSIYAFIGMEGNGIRKNNTNGSTRNYIKDKYPNPLTLLQSIFTRDGNLTDIESIVAIMKMSDSLPDLSLVIPGIVDNICHLSYFHDPLLQKMSILTDWISLSDTLSESRMRLQDYSLSSFFSPACAVSHLLCSSAPSSSTKRRIKLPFAYKEFLWNKHCNENVLVQFVIYNIGIGVNFRSSKTCCLEFLSHLHKLIFIPTFPLPSSSCSSSSSNIKLETFHSIVNIMNMFQLSLTSNSTVAPQASPFQQPDITTTTWLIDPPIFRLIDSLAIPPRSRHPWSNETCQSLSVALRVHQSTVSKPVIRQNTMIEEPTVLPEAQSKIPQPLASSSSSSKPKNFLLKIAAQCESTSKLKILDNAKSAAKKPLGAQQARFKFHQGSSLIRRQVKTSSIFTTATTKK